MIITEGFTVTVTVKVEPTPQLGALGVTMYTAVCDTFPITSNVPVTFPDGVDWDAPPVTLAP